MPSSDVWRTAFQDKAQLCSADASPVPGIEIYLKWIWTTFFVQLFRLHLVSSAKSSKVMMETHSLAHFLLIPKLKLFAWFYSCVSFRWSSRQKHWWSFDVSRPKGTVKALCRWTQLEVLAPFPNCWEHSSDRCSELGSFTGCWETEMVVRYSLPQCPRYEV